MNGRGFYTLFDKEVRRFMKVAVQTLLTPIITVLLYLLVFSSVLSEHVQVYPNVSYIAFLVPGLLMMSVIQNAFANSSSSLFQSKMTGNIVFMLLAPISNAEFFFAFTAAAVVRGVLVGLGIWFATLYFVIIPIHSVLTVIVFAVLGSAALGAIGLVAALWAEKWDHVAAFQNFLILPLSFLSGTFYSINSLPPFWSEISRYNPFFYMIDGFRYGFLGVADTSIYLSLSITLLFLVTVSSFCLWLLQIGYKIRG